MSTATIRTAQPRPTCRRPPGPRCAHQQHGLHRDLDHDRGGGMWKPCPDSAGQGRRNRSTAENSACGVSTRTRATWKQWRGRVVPLPSRCFGLRSALPTAPRGRSAAAVLLWQPSVGGAPAGCTQNRMCKTFHRSNGASCMQPWGLHRLRRRALAPRRSLGRPCS